MACAARSLLNRFAEGAGHTLCSQLLRVRARSAVCDDAKAQWEVQRIRD